MVYQTHFIITTKILKHPA